MDDAYQHRSVNPHFNILLSTYNQPFYEDFVLPAGRLRESRSGASRADVVVFSKCPDNMSTVLMQHIASKAAKYTKAETPVYFTGIRYGEAVKVYGQAELKSDSPAVVFTGIANHKPFTKHVQQHYKIIGEQHFPDHYNYKLSDIELLGSQSKILITTEKDMVKLLGDAFKYSGVTLYYIPIEIYFMNYNGGEETFLKKINKTIELAKEA